MYAVMFPVDEIPVFLETKPNRAKRGSSITSARWFSCRSCPVLAITQHRITECHDRFTRTARQPIGPVAMERATSGLA